MAGELPGDLNWIWRVRCTWDRSMSEKKTKQKRWLQIGRPRAREPIRRRGLCPATKKRTYLEILAMKIEHFLDRNVIFGEIAFVWLEAVLVGN